MKSKRFHSSFFSKWLVPILLIILLLGLLAVLVIVGISAVGIKLGY
ncbi:MAG: hypothetical protein ABSB41_06270 [Anaerolineales bacterium]|jgi:hypothetical protein